MNKKQCTIYMYIFAFLFFIQKGIYGQSEWTIRNPFPSHEMVKKMVWTGDKIIAITYQYLLTSPDGVTWAYQNYGTTGRLRDIYWTGENAVCVGEKGLVIVSLDGITWKRQNVDTSYSFYWVGQVDSLLVSGINKSPNKPGKCLISRNTGVTWEERTITCSPDSVSMGINSVCKFKKKYIASGGNALYISSDYFSWQQTYYDNKANIKHVTSTDSLIVAVGENGTVLTSEDGIAWEKHTIPDNVNFSEARWNGKILAAVGEGVGIRTSIDGIVWKIAEPFGWYESIIWTGNKFVAAGNGCVSSADAQRWTKNCLGMQTHYYGIAFNGANYVACNGGTYDKFLISQNGENWAICSTTVNARYDAGVVFDGKQFIAAGNSGIIITSPDGEKWTKQNTGTTETLYSISTNNSVTIVSNGYEKLILSSTDGAIWTRRDPAAANVLTPLFPSDKKLFVVPGNDTIFVSLDGIKWYTVPQAININSRAFKKIAWTGSKYYAATSTDDSLLLSNDGLHWEKRSFFSEHKNVDMYAILWTGKELIAVGTAPGDTAIMLCSEDGTSWKSVALPPCAGLLDICMGNGLLVTVGLNGQIITRPYETNLNSSDHIPKTKKSQMSVQPNLNQNKISIFFPRSSQKEVNAVFYNLIGKKICSVTKIITNNTVDFELKNFAAGNYVMNLMHGNERISLHVLVE